MTKTSTERTGSMVVVIPALTEKQRNAITAAAGEEGWQISFFDSEAEAGEAAETAEILFSTSPELAGRAKKLRWQCTPYAGTDLFYPGVFASPDAVLTNSSGAYGVTIAEHILMVTLELLRRQQEYTEITRRREWERKLPVRSVCGSRIVLLGTGDIGQEAARRLRAFRPASLKGVNTTGSNPDGLFDSCIPVEDLAGLLPETDILIMSLPGTKKARHVLDKEKMRLLPDGAVIVNVGRGSSIDEGALEQELRAGRLSAALDVFETEPLPQDSTLWDCPHLLVTPHAAGNMTLPYTVEKIVDLFLENFRRYCAGDPLLRRVDLERGY